MKRQILARAAACFAGVVLATTGLSAVAATTTVIPSQDNTVAQELPENSSGACDSIFSGRIDDNTVVGARRALIQFDIAAALPPGSVINSVTLSMPVTRGSNHIDSTFTLHPNTAAWPEGTEGCGVRGGGQGELSTGGVTWNSMPGFGAASASTLVNDTSPSWSSATMASEVQGWLDNPATNYGWVLIGDETQTTTTRRFDSREGGTPPALLIDYTPTGDVEACCETDGSCALTIVGSGTCGGTVQTGVDTCEPNPCPQPTGACCNTDNTCSDESRDVCEGAGGTFIGGNCNQANCGLTPFVEALPIPPVLQPTGTTAQGYPQYTVSVEEATQSVHPDLPDTPVWTYNGAWPAATIVAVQDQPVEVVYQNNLPTNSGGNRGSNILEVDTCAHGPNDWGDSKRISTHLHGGHVPSRVDGQPEYTILPGETDTYLYPNNQEAGTVWYHDHALGITRLNVYAGMAGFYLIADDEDTLGPDNAFGLPSGPYEIGLAIQDRTFNEDGSLFYNAQLEDAFKGEYAVVNGKVNPYLNVDQGKYRFRILNGSQSREYIYRLENITDPGNDPSFTLVGTDLGLVSTPIDLGNTTGTVIGPAERMDVVIDFEGYPAGTEIILRNDDPTTPLLPNLMKFIVTGNPGYTGTINSTLRTVTPMTEASADNTRYFRLEKHSAQACKDGSGRLVNEWVIQSLDGPNGNVTGEYWDDLTEFPVLGTREIWEFENPTNSYHPMHVHLVRFQILSKTDMTTGQSIPLQPWEANTWKDMVHIPANTRARIIMDFEDYPGRFPSHCHLLDHEDHEMMRQFQTTGGQCNSNGTCESGEDNHSCPSDCAQVSGAFCGNGLCEAGDGENCVSCAEDCAGRQKGGAQNQFCCGFDDGQVNNPIGCGVDASDNRCIDASANVFCRMTARLSASCGDALCEGQEQVQGPDYCQIDCEACSPTGTPETTCNGVDDDCDGQIDEDYAESPTSCGVGVCQSSGNLTCSGGSETDTCVPGSPTEPGTEVSCNDGLDNDCDGLTDANDPDCAVCVPDETPEQSCFDGSDNDCDTLVDCADTADCEGASGAPTSCGLGVCTTTGNLTCAGGSQTDNCSPLPATEPGTELTCDNGLDDDCDGLADTADPDCAGGVVCSSIPDKPTCNNEPTCEWQGSPKNGSCIDIVACTPDENPEVS
ncbi:MAG: multicopper oxidase domain-containing protein, partial [Gammaproteobacteria bacterium]